MIKFAVRLGDHTINFQFDHRRANNWKIYIGTTTMWRYSLDFQQTLNLFASNKAIWCKALFALINDPRRIGLHLPKKYRIVGQMYLTWFGLPNTKAALDETPDFPTFLSCEYGSGKHQLAPDFPQCLSCGLYVPNVEEEEEEEAAEICPVCEQGEEDCACVVCDFCGQRDKDCICLICENEGCGRCKCTDKFHIRIHKAAVCPCEPACTPKEHKKKHPRLRCECDKKFCEGCGFIPENCDCPEESSGEYYY
jgi:hypothetical protein